MAVWHSLEIFRINFSVPAGLLFQGLAGNGLDTAKKSNYKPSVNTGQDYNS